jgi:Glycosyl hydrolases family 2/Glycosyl hydrolases family 2, TIM barrel domain/Glycosyl hydrolases family 2, sugar binding domain
VDNSFFFVSGQFIFPAMNLTQSARAIVSLNGTWQLQPGNGHTVPGSWNHAVEVPALVDIASPRYDWKGFRYHWYRRTVKVESLRDCSFLIIEQAMFGTDVWLNGKFLGGDIACYTSQEYDLREALKPGENELVVRVGQREDLPLYSAVGNDLERAEWIPGIWGDVVFVQSGNPRISLVQTLPRIEESFVEVRVTVHNTSQHEVVCSLRSVIRERSSSRGVADDRLSNIRLHPESTKVLEFRQRIDNPLLWSPGNPFLYVAESTVLAGDMPVDHLHTPFGMREFNIVGSDFTLNGELIFLRGGNIAFHRFLSDAGRKRLPWDREWIRKVLIDIPKAHNFNYFRNHLGHMYNRWYDIADENGILLQDEWMFWTTRGSKEQITKEFTRWLQDNWNHPSIVMWDALNECTDGIVQNEIVPAMKALDPTRPWESVDVVEDHPYIYSLGMVLNDRPFGFTRSISDIEHSDTPSMVNEFCWWWLDKDDRPSSLMKNVVERWLGPEWTREELVAHQSFLVQELVELFRRMRVGAIQPFVYLSNDAGPTANWFAGNINEARLKPVMKALRNAFAPLGVSIELWDRHFFPGERREINVFVVNDGPRSRVSVRFGLMSDDGAWSPEAEQRVDVDGLGRVLCSFDPVFPAISGRYRVRAELWQEDMLISFSEKPAHVIERERVSSQIRNMRVKCLEKDGELATFLRTEGINVTPEPWDALPDCAVLIVSGNSVQSPEYRSRVRVITNFVESGKTLILIEPEYGINGRVTIDIARDVRLVMEKRVETDKGGYDSYVFADDIDHPLWNGIDRDHLKMFNGAFGGEAVSEHTVLPDVPHTILARCGLGLGVTAVCEIPVGKGNIIVSRLQVRGRLVPNQNDRGIYARRPDPVLQKFIINLLRSASGNGEKTVVRRTVDQSSRVVP